jgi:hypothetical protein
MAARAAGRCPENRGIPGRMTLQDDVQETPGAGRPGTEARLARHAPGVVAVAALNVRAKCALSANPQT